MSEAHKVSEQCKFCHFRVGDKEYRKQVTKLIFHIAKTMGRLGLSHEDVYKKAKISKSTYFAMISGEPVGLHSIVSVMMALKLKIQIKLYGHEVNG